MDKVMYYRDLVARLSHIGIEISAERNIDHLLLMILKESMAISNADAGSIYFVEKDKDFPQLAFKYTHNQTVDFPYKQFKMPMDTHSIAGACAVTGQIFNFKSMDETIEKLGFHHNSSYDEAAGYHTLNMLTIPLKNYTDEVIGVLQLINKKNHQNPLVHQRDYSGVVAFTHEDESIIGALASQVAILIERTQLFESVQNTLESTIKVLVNALDQRDPVTSGHSGRVAQYALDLGKYLQALTDGFHSRFCLKEDELKELYIAGLLHDVGKIGVPEHLLQKSDKLTDSQMESIHNRHKMVVMALRSGQGAFSTGEIVGFETRYSSISALLDKVNKAGILLPEELEVLKELSRACFSWDEESFYLLKDFELEQLSVPRGNLTDMERLAINNHVVNSYDLLSGVNWTESLKAVPLIASMHHEKLNGHGYPYAKKGDELSLRARLLAIADIYDALTAKDRPYKAAMPIPKALSILKEEASKGALDEELVLYFEKMIVEREAVAYGRQ